MRRTCTWHVVPGWLTPEGHMITTIFSGNSRIEKSILAVNLAAWRVRQGHSVLVLDAEVQRHAFLWNVRRGGRQMLQHLAVAPVLDRSLYAELEKLNTSCQDLVIDVDGLDDADTRTALVAAQMVVVPLCAQAPDKQVEACATAFLERAQLFNPLLRVVLAVIEGQDADTVGAFASAHAMARRLRSASVTQTVLHDSAAIRGAFRKGQMIVEVENECPDAFAELEVLGIEVFGEPGTISVAGPNLRAAMVRLRAWQQ
ncbi:hypothetical protein [Noviherbaspirillum sp.]|uniref:hypothetical protein n=1 Tax=Noviherbaspirillum sp. TaxID=1926288 RepID=UPI002B487B73|nr:hypothetical protein [Noviherbaspirillum sp.]HJV79348.1 hypothetical protein [Noviherbaspirillum sp.]